MRGLVYLEWRYAVHQAAAILRSPLRLALWIPYALTLVVLVYSRTAGPAHGPSFAGGFANRYGDTIVGLYIGTLGSTIARAAGGRVFAFRNSAEAVLFSNAGIRPLEIALWLQVRKLGASGVRFVTGVTYVFLIFAPRHGGAFANASVLGVALLAVALQMSVDLPAFLVARGRLQRPVEVLGWAVAAAGFGFGALALLAPARIPPIVDFLRFDPGLAFAALFHGNVFGVLVLVVVLGALIATVALLGDDALPELYAVSKQTRATGTRSGRASKAPERFIATGAGANRGIPPGAFTLVWKDWIGFRRGRGNFRRFLFGCAFSASCGVAVAVIASVSSDPSLLLTLASAAAIALLVAAPFGASLGLANDLSKPLFWLSRASLRARLGAWTFARTWRASLAIGLAPLVAGIVARNLPLAVAALPLALAIYWSLQSLGVGLFALFPNPIDSRGPMLFVRAFATAAYAIPPLVLAIVAIAAHAAPLVAAFGSAVVFALEGWLVVEFAALRFAGRSASFTLPS